MSLRWDRVDLKRGLIRLHPGDTKTGEGRVIPLTPFLTQALMDLRHTFVANARRAKVDYFRIMAITGHTTLRVFRRYHLIDAGNLQEAMTSLQTYPTSHEMDTSMDTEPVDYASASAATSRASRG